MNLYNYNYDIYLNITNRVKKTQIHDEMNKLFIKKMLIDDKLFNIMFEIYFRKINIDCSTQLKHEIAQFFKDCLLCNNDLSISDLIDEIGHQKTSDFMMCKIEKTEYDMKYASY